MIEWPVRLEIGSRPEVRSWGTQDLQEVMYEVEMRQEGGGDGDLSRTGPVGAGFTGH